MKNILAFSFLLLCASAYGQTYYVTFENHGVDSFFLHETEIHVVGNEKHSHTTSTEFSDTAQLTQFIQDIYLKYTHIDAEATRLRDEADRMLARHDSIVAGRAVESLSIRPFDPVINPSVQPVLNVETKQKPKAIKPKRKKRNN